MIEYETKGGEPYDDGVRIDSPEGPVAFNVIDCSANLIAAAPELLRICRSLLGMLGDVYEDDFYRHGSPSEDAWPTMLADARAVIATAEGRSE